MARTKQTKSPFVRGSEADEVQVIGAKNSYVLGRNNKKYVDFLDGWCVGNLGWDNREIKKAIRQFNGPDYVYPGFGYRPWEELAALLISIAPGKLARCFRATGGSEAVDLAMQAAMLHTGRRGFVSLEDSYHGNTLATLSIGASENRETLKNLLPHCHKIEPPLDRNAAGKVEKLLKRRDIAAFIMEPISISLGVLVPDREFIVRVQAACKRTGTLFIADEVATGFGRTGKLFASEHVGLEPDIMCLAKAITGGAGGMGALIATAPVAKTLDEEGNAYSTYGWHPLSTQAAIASVRYMVRHQQRLLDHIERMSDYFRRRLSGMRFRHPAALHIRGMAIGVDVENETYATKVHARCRDQGLLFSAEGSTLLLLPALNITRKTAKAGLDILEDCV